MRAIAITTAGGPEVLRPVTLPRPIPLPGQVLIEVSAAGVNRPDLVQRAGRYPVPPDASPLPGLEVSGTVVGRGEGVHAPDLGARVIALTHGGGYAEYVAVDAAHCLPFPEGLNVFEAACLPEVAFTVEFNMIMRAGLRPGETVLIHGGSSGIGAHAIERAKGIGARVVTTGGSDEKLDFARSLGADLAVSYRGDWVREIRDRLGEGPIDVVLDMVAGDYVARNLSLLARDGRYALIALLGGATASVPMNDVLRRALTLTGSTLRPQSNSVKAAIARAVGAGVLPLIAAGKIRPRVHSIFPLKEATQAHFLMESGQHMGKIALNVSDGF